MSANRIYPVPIKPFSGITNWGQWPPDVEPLLRAWNRGRGGGLSFRHWQDVPEFWGPSTDPDYRYQSWLVRVTARGVFKCTDCGLFCDPGPTVVVHRGDLLCDDCLIDRARAYLAQAA